MILVRYVLLILVSFMFMAGWQRLADKLMETRTPLRRYIAYFCVCIPVQFGFNILVQSVPFLAEYVYDTAYWTIFCFTIQAVIMVLMLYRHAYLPKAISAVALSYFFFYNLLVMFDLLVCQPLYLWTLEAFPTADATYLHNGYSILLHLFSLLASFLVGALLDATHFAGHFGSLFARRKRAVAVCVISILLMHSLQGLLLLFPEWQDSYVYYWIFIGFTILTLFAMLFTAIFEANREKVKQQEVFIAQQQVYVQTLESLQQDLRAFRHDYQNLLSGLYLQASEGDNEAIQDTLKSTIRYFDDRLGNQIHRVTELSRVEIPEVKSLLLVKLMQAEEAGVPIQLEIPAPVSQLSMNHGDFLRCLGILVDNAIEACTGVQGATVRIALLQEQNDLLVVVANPAAEKPALHRLEKPGYTTKGEGRGTGLTSYRRLTTRYTNVATATAYEGGAFRQTLQIRRLA